MSVFHPVGAGGRGGDTSGGAVGAGELPNAGQFSRTFSLPGPVTLDVEVVLAALLSPRYFAVKTPVDDSSMVHVTNLTPGSECNPSRAYGKKHQLLTASMVDVDTQYGPCNQSDTRE
jgi:hypothetical protein